MNGPQERKLNLLNRIPQAVAPNLQGFGDMSFTCVKDQQVLVLSQLIFSVVSMPVHIFLVIALIIYRKKLQQSVLNLYGANVVACNFIYSLVAILNEVMLIAGDETIAPGLGNRKVSSIHAFFFFRASLMVMFLVISGGISLMLINLKRSFFRIHRTVAGSKRSFASPRKGGTDRGKTRRLLYGIRFWLKKNPGSKAAIDIAIAWILAIVVGAVAFHDGGCSLSCHCLFGYVPSNSSISRCPERQECNVVFVPFSNNSIIIIFVAWLMYVFMLVGLLIAAFGNFYHAMLESRHTKAPKSSKKTPLSAMQSLTDNDGHHNLKTEVTDDANVEGNNNREDYVARNLEAGNATLERLKSFHSNPANSLLFEALKKNLYFLCIVTVIAIVGTGAISIPVFAASVSDQVEKIFLSGSELPLIPVFALVIFIPAVNSILICVTLQGMRTAVTTMLRVILQKICFCTGGY